jgi:hypothetical protein
MAAHALNDIAAEVEWRRDQAVREMPCRVCGAAAGQACRSTVRSPTGAIGAYMPIGHTGRYTDARAAGVLPPLHCQVCGDGVH